MTDDPIESESPKPTPRTPKKGVYVLEQGDTPGSVSVKLFGRGHRAVDLVVANPDVYWDVGDEIQIP